MILIQFFRSAGELQHHNPMHSSMWNRNWLVDHISLRICKSKLYMGFNVIIYFSPDTKCCCGTPTEEKKERKKENGSSQVKRGEYLPKKVRLPFKLTFVCTFTLPLLQLRFYHLNKHFLCFYSSYLNKKRRKVSYLI